MTREQANKVLCKFNSTTRLRVLLSSGHLRIGRVTWGTDISGIIQIDTVGEETAFIDLDSVIGFETTRNYKEPQ